MGALAIPSAYDEKSMLIADDEPEHLEWLVDFVESLGLKVTIAINVAQAMAACEKTRFRIYIIDLNIPLGTWPLQSNKMFASYPGFTIIQAIRSQGNDGRRVIAYSAHSNELINSEMKRLYTDYIAKGRPIQLKERIRELLTQPDMTATAVARAGARAARKKIAAMTPKQTPNRQPKAVKKTAKSIPGAAGTKAKKTSLPTSRVKKLAKPT